MQKLTLIFQAEELKGNFIVQRSVLTSVISSLKRRMLSWNSLEGRICDHCLLILELLEIYVTPGPAGPSARSRGSLMIHLVIEGQ